MHNLCTLTFEKVKWDYRPPISFTEREVMLYFTIVNDQSELQIQACHVIMIVLCYLVALISPRMMLPSCSQNDLIQGMFDLL